MSIGAYVCETVYLKGFKMKKVLDWLDPESFKYTITYDMK
jgi:hypothetical protein